MGRLAGFSYREVARRLKAFGFQFDRSGAGSHEIWRHAETGKKVTLPHHSGDMAILYDELAAVPVYVAKSPSEFYRHKVRRHFQRHNARAGLKPSLYKGGQVEQFVVEFVQIGGGQRLREPYFHGRGRPSKLHLSM